MNDFRLLVFATLGLVATFCGIPVAQAQTAGTGALTITATDPGGGVIPGASVTIANPATGQTRSEVTDASGSYTFTLLFPGNYDVKISASGFKVVEVPSVAVNVTETHVLNQAMSVGTCRR